MFDLGNVLIKFKPKEFFLNYSQNRDWIEDIASKIIGTDIWLQLDKGILSINDAKKRFSEKIPNEIEFLNWFFDNWLDMFHPIEKNVEILANLSKNGYKIYYLSNYIKEIAELVNHKLGFFKYFDGGVYSYEIHAIKPERKIYETLNSRYDLDPNKCVFLDDYQSFLDVAAQFGMKTIHVTQNTDIQEELRKLNIKV